MFDAFLISLITCVCLQLVDIVRVLDDASDKLTEEEKGVCNNILLTECFVVYLDL